MADDPRTLGLRRGMVATPRGGMVSQNVAEFDPHSVLPMGDSRAEQGRVQAVKSFMDSAFPAAGRASARDTAAYDEDFDDLDGMQDEDLAAGRRLDTGSPVGRLYEQGRQDKIRAATLPAQIAAQGRTQVAGLQGNANVRRAEIQGQAQQGVAQSRSRDAILRAFAQILASGYDTEDTADPGLVEDFRGLARGR